MDGNGRQRLDTMFSAIPSYAEEAINVPKTPYKMSKKSGLIWDRRRWKKAGFHSLAGKPGCGLTFTDK
jgi:hypothetical protein